MEIRDSRRLTGPNILQQETGAVLDIVCPPGTDPRSAIEAWRHQAERFLSAVGWASETLSQRRFAQGFSVAFSAPIDALYAATEVNEQAWAAAQAVLRGAEPEDFEEAVAALRQTIEAEENPKLLALEAAARQRGVAFLWDDGRVSIGHGQGSLGWDARSLPDPADIDWDAVHDVPVALVTGTNGKTTTVRLLAAMARAAGKEAGLSSTDGVWVAGEEIGEGDYSGPGGARLALRDPRVGLGLLETARGGMLRRGLGVEAADVAIITNVAEDHLGEWGVHDLEELAATKMIVARAARRLVINGDDPLLRAARPIGQDIWIGLDPSSEPMRAHLEAGGEAYVLDGSELVHLAAGGRQALATLEEAPMTLGGAARHNVANALGAIAVARVLGLEERAIRQGLGEFASSAEENPGRLNRFDLGGVRVLVDFAHNPHGMMALIATAQGLPARRRLVLLGQAGDRDDESIRDLTRQVWQGRPDRIIAKDLLGHLRGREPGELPRLMLEELRALGAPEHAISSAPSELDAVRQALEWAEVGDLLLLVVHEERQAVLAWVSQLERDGWKPARSRP